MFLKHRTIAVISIILSTFLAAGCSNGFPPRVHKMDIRQGSDITSTMVAKLRKGMTREQVQATLGTPTLTHALNTDRWDYYYSFKSGKTGKMEERPFAVFFKGNHLDHWSEEK